MAHSSQPGLLVGNIELGQLTYPLTARGTLNCNGKNTIIYLSNQMMSEKKKRMFE